DVPQHDGAGSDVGGGIEGQFSLLGTNCCCTQASTGLPAFSAGVHCRFLAISTARLVMLSTSDAITTRASRVVPSGDTWTARITRRGTSVASAGKLMKGGTVGWRGVSKHAFPRLYSGPGSAHMIASDGAGFLTATVVVPGP